MDIWGCFWIYSSLQPTKPLEDNMASRVTKGLDRVIRCYLSSVQLPDIMILAQKRTKEIQWIAYE